MSGNIMTSELPEELRLLFLSEEGITPSTSDDGLNDDEAKSFSEAMKMFKNEIHPLFTTLWGEIWINNSQIDGGGINFNSRACQLWFICLQGLNTKHVAKALDEFVNDTGGKYPPNPLQFRYYCKNVKQKDVEQSGKDRNLQLLN